MNNSTLSNHHDHQLSTAQLTQVITLSFMLVACLFGNILVVTAIMKTKKLRTPSNLLIVNLSFCDIMTSVSGIPFTGIVYNICNGALVYPYGEVGCKLLWPFTTYASNCCAFTLLTIAIERYLNIASVRPKFTKRICALVVAIIHLAGALLVVPYSVALKYIVAPTNEAYCVERWSIPGRRVYTLALFLIQYAFPLTGMTIFYVLAWKKLYVHNITMIKMSEEYEQKMDWNKTDQRRASVFNGLNADVLQNKKSADTSGKSKMSNIKRKVNNRRKGKDQKPKPGPRRRSSALPNKSGYIQPNPRRESLKCSSDHDGNIFTRKKSEINISGVCGGLEGRKKSQVGYISINGGQRTRKISQANSSSRRQSISRRRSYSAENQTSLDSLHRKRSVTSRPSTFIENSSRKRSQVFYTEPNNGRRNSRDFTNRRNSVKSFKYTAEKQQSRCGDSIVSIEKQIYQRKTSTYNYSSQRRNSGASFSSINSSTSFKGSAFSTGSNSSFDIGSKTSLRSGSSASTLRRADSNASVKEMKRFNKSPYSSQTAFTRHMQTVKTLKMFSVVVLVFACFALPNQISWLIGDFSTHLSPKVVKIFIILTHVSSVVNCWIYGGFHNGIRKAYIELLCCCFCRSNKRGSFDRTTSQSTITMASLSLYDNTQEEQFRRRMSSFNRIFDDAYKNYDKVQHLYQSGSVEEWESEEEEEIEAEDESMNEFRTNSIYCELEEISEEAEYSIEDIENSEDTLIKEDLSQIGDENCRHIQ